MHARNLFFFAFLITPASLACDPESTGSGPSSDPDALADGAPESSAPTPAPAIGISDPLPDGYTCYGYWSRTTTYTSNVCSSDDGTGRNPPIDIDKLDPNWIDRFEDEAEYAANMSCATDARRNVLIGSGGLGEPGGPGGLPLSKSLDHFLRLRPHCEEVCANHPEGPRRWIRNYRGGTCTDTDDLAVQPPTNAPGQCGPGSMAWLRKAAGTVGCSCLCG